MIKLHKEGIKPMFVVLLLLVGINYGVHYITENEIIRAIFILAALVFYGFVINFFRNPPRFTKIDPYTIVAPCDGKVVVIEEAEEDEYFTGKRRQISIFMSPLNVHVNRYPVGGTITYAKYHPGKFMVAWHPKASTLNERTTVVVRGEFTGEVLYRQIAGAVARRIVMYAKKGAVVKQGADSGFIKFGSRVDLFLPLDAEINVAINEITRGGETVVATIKPNNIN